jgi:hypothetical protein
MINDNYLFALIWRRMREMGYCKYHVQTEAFDLAGIGARKQVKAYNEFYYLISKNVPDDTEVISDTNYYKAKDHSSLELYGMQEFSGSLTMKRGAADTKLEFVRVLIEK